MNLLRTKSFTVATYSAGAQDSEKLAIVLPGRLETKDYAHVKSHVQHLGKLGFHAISFDPPGTWESPGALSLYTTPNYCRAVNEIIEHFGNKQTLLVGHSKGGSVAMLVAIENTHVEGFIAIMSTAAAIPDNEWEENGFHTFYRDLPPGDGPSTEQREFKLPYAYFENQLMADLKSYPKPKLFVWGKHDYPEQSDAVKEAFVISAGPKEIYELNSGHGYRYNSSAIEKVNAEMTRFVKEYNLN